jgi:hypothetical protein
LHKKTIVDHSWFDVSISRTIQQHSRNLLRKYQYTIIEHKIYVKFNGHAAGKILGLSFNIVFSTFSIFSELDDV